MVQKFDPQNGCRISKLSSLSCIWKLGIASDAIFSSLLPAMLVGNNHQLDRSFLNTLGPPFVTALSKGFPTLVSGGVRNEDTSVACKVELECV